MAGEVNSQLTIKLDGGSTPVSAPSEPISRASQLTWGPGQMMADYAGDRRARFTREVAKEIARDREASRELATIRQKNQIRYEAEEVASAVRSAEERIRRRDSLASSVRENRPQMADGFFTEDRAVRGLKRGGVTTAKRFLRGFGTGIAAGVGSSLVMPSTDEEGPGGFLARATLATTSGAAWGGLPGAIGSLLLTSFSEIAKGLTQKDKEIEELRKSIAEIGKDSRKFLSDFRLELHSSMAELEKKFDEGVRGVVVDSQDLRRREEQFEYSNLVK